MLLADTFLVNASPSKPFRSNSILYATHSMLCVACLEKHVSIDKMSKYNINLLRSGYTWKSPSIPLNSIARDIAEKEWEEKERKRKKCILDFGTERISCCQLIQANIYSVLVREPEKRMMRAVDGKAKRKRHFLFVWISTSECSRICIFHVITFVSKRDKMVENTISPLTITSNVQVS